MLPDIEFMRKAESGKEYGMEELIKGVKIGKAIGRAEKKNDMAKIVVIVIATISTVLAILSIAYVIYRKMNEEDYYDDFEDDFEDDLFDEDIDDDIFED